MSDIEPTEDQGEPDGKIFDGTMFVGDVIRGALYGDKKGRFEDGTMVYTSIVKSIKFSDDYPEAGDTVRTTFSEYEVIWATEGERRLAAAMFGKDSENGGSDAATAEGPQQETP